MPKRPSAAAAAAQHPVVPAAMQPLISDQRLRHLYVTLLRCRLLRRRSRLTQPASLLASEAIVTGTVTHLGEGDAIIPFHGDRLAALAFGHAPRRVLSGASLTGVLPEASTTEASFAIAAGYAMAHRGEKHVVIAFSGPGVTSLEALRPALAYAAQAKLGIVFVVETAANADISSARHTDPLGLYGIPVDGNDVIAVYRVAQEAIARARRGLGPTLIDCKPWPLDGAIDPVRKLEQALVRRGLPTQHLKRNTLATFSKQLRSAGRSVKPRG